jgi:sulfonate transport system ATP-binding protein
MAIPALKTAPAPRTAAGAGNPGNPHVSVRSVDKRFGAKQVLSGLDLDVAEGEFVALVGRSGCGKSTLLRLIAGLDGAFSGTIRVRGHALKGLNTEARVMFQEARLLPWKTVEGNVALGLDAARRKEALAVLGQVGLADRAGDWPAVLSGGQSQRVALARALASRPDLLLLDEPLGSLDALTRIEMQELIQGLWLERRFTALLITHEVEEALVLADRVVVLEEGRIAFEAAVDLPRPRDRGTPEFAALKSGILRRILGRDLNTAYAQKEPGAASSAGPRSGPENGSFSDEKTDGERRSVRYAW